MASKKRHCIHENGDRVDGHCMGESLRSKFPEGPPRKCLSGVQTIASYRPTEEEWKDPMKYIASITEESSAYGMAHIIPPESWDPPFALLQSLDGIGMDSFLFKARRQKTSKLCRRSADEGEFGFPVIEGTYTLEEFARHADMAKSKHFGAPSGLGHPSEDYRRAEYSLPRMSPSEISPSVEEIEEEFWRIVEGESGEYEALYGSDLDNLTYGSGFPMPFGERWELMRKRFEESRGVMLQKRHNDTVCDESSYRNHPWNVNNMPLAYNSLLRYVHHGKNSLISGVMVPWMYIGSCFSAFNWHVEDHALYSVNYIHFGSPKVWYSVPGDCSEQLEKAMRDALPHLFEASPSLLYELVTQLSPQELIRRGVPVYRVVHDPRTFIVTMPSAYHDGFNTGFNVAESVNFAALPWLPHGSKVVKKYVKSRRSVTISHDALLCRMVLDAGQTDVSEFKRDMGSMAIRELKQRIEELSREWHVMDNRFGSLGFRAGSIPCISQNEDGPDTPNTRESDCLYCKADLWLMAFYSTNDPSALVCINHAHLLVSEIGVPIESIRMTYQYRIPELVTLVSNVQVGN